MSFQENVSLLVDHHGDIFNEFLDIQEIIDHIEYGINDYILRLILLIDSRDSYYTYISNDILDVMEIKEDTDKVTRMDNFIGSLRKHKIKYLLLSNDIYKYFLQKIQREDNIHDFPKYDPKYTGQHLILPTHSIIYVLYSVSTKKAKYHKYLRNYFVLKHIQLHYVISILDKQFEDLYFKYEHVSNAIELLTHNKENVKNKVYKNNEKEVIIALIKMYKHIDVTSIDDLEYSVDNVLYESNIMFNSFVKAIYFKRLYMICINAIVSVLDDILYKDFKHFINYSYSTYIRYMGKWPCIIHHYLPDHICSSADLIDND